MLEQVAGFDWDEGNRDKCAKHGVTLEQIEQLFRSTLHVFPALKHLKAGNSLPGYRTRRGGSTHLRGVHLAEPAGQRLIRPISARFMNAQGDRPL